METAIKSLARRATVASRGLVVGLTLFAMTSGMLLASAPPAPTLMPQGAVLMGFAEPQTAASSQTIQSKLSQTIATADFLTLAAALSRIGSNKASLQVNSAVTVTRNLTIPSNVDLVVNRLGSITVNPGFVLKINGTFSAPRLHQAFASSLLTTTITGTIYGNTLNVTNCGAYAALAPGWVITGAGICPGSKITIDGTGGGGNGSYLLNNMNATIASANYTATGPSVVFGPGTVERVYPQWFGAIPDTNVTDNGPAFYQAVLSMPWGGEVRIPSGNYMFNTGGIVLHPTVSIVGDCNDDTGTGNPANQNTTAPTYLWLNTSSTQMFIISRLDSQIYFKNITFSADSFSGGVNLTPNGTSKVAILITGHYGQFVYGLVWENCYFFNFYQAVLINDSWAPGSTDSGDPTLPLTGYYTMGLTCPSVTLPTPTNGNVYQLLTAGKSTNLAVGAGLSCVASSTLSGTPGTVGWVFVSNGYPTNGTTQATLSALGAYFEFSVNPYTFRNCHFFCNKYGVLINANEVDAGRYEDCVWAIPVNCDGIRVVRSGYFKLDNCFAGLANLTGVNTKSAWVHVVGNGVGALNSCKVIMDTCQAESLAQFLWFDGTSTNDVAPEFTTKDCLWQMNTTITLGKTCEYTGYSNYVQGKVCITGTGVRVNSFAERFYSSYGYKISGGDAQSLWTMVPGLHPQSDYPNPIFNGIPSMCGCIPSSAFPTYTFPQGAVIWNSAVTATTTPGWVCTAAGTPGTWTAMPVL